VSGNGEKGKFDTNISQQVIEEALRSVRKHAPEPAEVPVEIETAGSEEGSSPVPGESSAAQAEIDELRAQLELSQAKGREVMEKLRDQHEKMLRAAADLDNFKKRAQKEKEELQKYGAEKLLRAFLPVIDNLDRALEHAKSPAEFQSFVQGVAMTRKLFEDTLAKNGVRPFSAMGQAFDPRMHEAMQQLERADVPPNQVVSELLRGFMLNDRLLRPAMVMVSKPPVSAAAEGGAAEPAAEEAKATQQPEVPPEGGEGGGST
jgi:molecular chaperone GrpE